MLRLTPTSNTAYTLDLTSSRGPPIAEAGFTITGLTPTYSNGSGIMTQQQNFVLLGGHTQTAFINMSQVAIWSLPEESWSFVNVDSPSSSSNPNTELTVKSTATSVDSRSGHTAVLTEDGTKIIVFGGWVGDVSQAADPQLAVLNLGTGFGGTGDWVWSVPSEQPSGTGMYGHGAVMLPGNVMMVLGGYNISTTGISKRDGNSGIQAMFLNTTSMTWTSNYTNPSYVAAIASSAAKSSSSAKSNSKKVGLGAGLGIGLAAVLAAVAVYIWYNRRMKRKREDAREKNLQGLSNSAANFYASPNREMGHRRGGFPWANGGWNGNGGDQYGPAYDSTSAVAGYENLHSGVHGLGDSGAIPPPPKQIPRKPLHSRNARGIYQPAPNFDPHVRANSLGTAGPIHPIYEADEDDHVHDHGQVGVALEDPLSAPASANTKRYSDPFKDPPIANLSNHLRRENRSISTPSPESPAQEREREIQAWVSDWAAADALLNSQARSHSTAGRLSPSRRAQLIAASNVSSVSGDIDDSGRTASNLSERSVAISAMTISRSGSSSQGRSRSNSLRGFIANAINPFASTILTTTIGSTNVSPVFDGPGPHGPRSYPLPKSAGSGASSFTTAHTSFPALQAEGESLLPRPDDQSTGEYSPTRSQGDSPGSPSKSKGRQLGWLGSLRRAFAGDSGSGNASSDTTSFSSGERSPVRITPDIGTGSVEPRRTVSAGATLWRRKQGKGDWEDSADDSVGTPGRSNTFTGDLTSLARGEEDEEEDEWDIERAVQNRVVQVMFTVPKEKLRVVNHDVDDEKSEIGSLRSKKGSLKNEGIVAENPVVLDTVPESVSPARTASPEGKGKGKGKVLEMVEKMEGRNSPAR